MKGKTYMKCSKCGNEIEEGAAFCKYCGNPITNVKESMDTVLHSKTTTNFKLSDYKKYIIGIAVVLIIFLLGKKIFGGASMPGGFSSIEEFVESYISAMESRNENDYLACFPEDLRGSIADGIENSYGFGDDAIHSPYRFMLASDGYLDFSYSGNEDIPQEELDFYNEKYSYKASEGKYVDVKFSHAEEGFGGTVTHSNTVRVPVVKIGKKWYALEPLEITGGWPLEY